MQRQIFFKSDSTTNGFTLLEVLITVILIGILFAIAAPNWVAFMNQQRVSSARSQVSQAIRNAQSQAQQTKVNHAVVFDNNSDQPRYAIVAAPNDQVDRAQITNWQVLGEGSIQSGIIRLWSDRTAPLVFDGNGAVVTNSLPYKITIGATISTNLRRCVSVETILGATSEGSDGNCPAPQ